MPEYIDHVSDQGGVEMIRLFETFNDVIPNFVKQANFDNVMGQHKRSRTVYADPMREKFPCDNAASTFLSHMYYYTKQANYTTKERADIEKRLNHYTNYWGIRRAVDQFLEVCQNQTKIANDKLPDSDYGYVWVDEDGNKNRLFRLTSTVEVKEAADTMQKILTTMPFTDRHMVATRILSKAASLGAGLPSDQLEMLERNAGRGANDPDKIANMLLRRAKLAKDVGLRSNMERIAEAMLKTPEYCRDPMTMVKLAQTVYEFDQSVSVRPDSYNEALPRPEDVIFAVTYSKTANTIKQHVETHTGTIYTKEALANIPLATLRDLFGDDIADAVKKAGSSDVDPEKMATVLPTLPRPDAELFDKLMLQSKLPPAMRKAASSGRGYTRDQLRKLAATVS